MYNMGFFSYDPKIFWTKVLCPICKEPTGSKSNCHELELSTPDHKKVLTSDLGVLPILSKNCTFKQSNLWKAEINYPFSHKIYDIIKNIRGVDSVQAISKYQFQIVVGRLFDENEIKKSISLAYKSFIKNLHAIETDHESLSSIDKITFPNGAVYENIGDQSVELRIISEVLNLKG